MLKGLCSHCHEDFMKCRCEHFHPNMKEEFTLNEKEINALLSYFVERAGFISYEFDMEVHKVITRLQEFVKENKNG